VSAVLPVSRVLRFEDFEIDLAAGLLHKGGIRISLRDQSFQVLAALLEHPGQVVSRDELRRRLWPENIFVDFDNNLNAAIARLREALCDSADHPRFIETLPKRGYRFLTRVFDPPLKQEATPATRVRLVVLPFLNLSGDPGQEYLSDAMTDEIITEVARLAPELLAVIARTTAMYYKGSRADVAQVGRDLGVDYVVEGSVRRDTARFELNVQLIQVSDQMHVFAKKYDADIREIFNVQRVVALDIAHRIGVAALQEDVWGTAAIGKPPGRKPTEDLVAYHEYIQGRHHADKGTVEDLAAGRMHLEKAIARDPEFALAYDSLAEIYWYLGYLGLMRPQDAFSAGIVHALRAIEIENTRAETHALLGQFHKTVAYNWVEVQREMALALRLNPHSPLVRMRYAVSGLMPHGRLEQAVAELECALELDPLSVLARFWLGIMLLLQRHGERAMEESRKLLDLAPTFWGGHFVIAVGYRFQGRVEEAIASQRKAVDLFNCASMLGWLGLTLASGGQIAEAREVLQRLHGMAAKGYVPATSFAWVHLGLKETDVAFQWLDRAVDECDQFMMPIKSYAFFDPIRSDPRFAALLRKMRLEA
jgi:TolB-like protein/Tfp pilus assembly protein PilF